MLCCVADVQHGQPGWRFGGVRDRPDVRREGQVRDCGTRRQRRVQQMRHQLRRQGLLPRRLGADGG